MQNFAKSTAGITTFIVVMSLLAAAGLFNEGWDRGRAVGEKEANLDAYARSADQEIADRCYPLDPSEMAACIREVLESLDENERAERDLVAQLDAARWGLWIAVLSSIGTGIGVLGTVLIWQTFKETRSAVMVAREGNAIAAREQRAWLKLEIAPRLILADGQLRLEISCNPRNIGHKPAFLTRIWFKIIDDKGASRGDVQAESLEEVVDGLANAFAVGSSLIFPGDSGMGWAPDVQIDPGLQAKFVAIVAAVSYRLEGEEQLRYTFASFVIHVISKTPNQTLGEAATVDDLRLSHKPGSVAAAS